MNDLMKDLSDARWIKFKAVLFVVMGIATGVLLIIEHPSLYIAALIVLCIWSFCRAYYFAFYVIEHYIDPGYRFSGLLCFARYVLRKQRHLSVTEFERPKAE